MHGTGNKSNFEKIESKLNKYFYSYEGYISSHDYSKADDDELFQLDWVNINVKFCFYRILFPCATAKGPKQTIIAKETNPSFHPSELDSPPPKSSMRPKTTGPIDAPRNPINEYAAITVPR